MESSQTKEEKITKVLGYLAQGLLQKEIADKMGVKPAAISKWLKKYKQSKQIPEVKDTPKKLSKTEESSLKVSDTCNTDFKEFTEEYYILFLKNQVIDETDPALKQLNLKIATEIRNWLDRKDILTKGNKNVLEQEERLYAEIKGELTQNEVVSDI